LVALRKEIRVRKKKEAEDKRKKRAELWENILLWGGITLIVLFTFGFALFFLLFYYGRL
jgi:hypothetical protein